MVIFGGFNLRRLREFRTLALEEERQSEILKAEQLAKECETNPTLRHQMQLEAQQKLEAQRDYAFDEMQRWELQRISTFAGHKQFWAWYKQAKSELQQLREAERLNREHLTRESDSFTRVRRNPLSRSINPYGIPASPSSDPSNEFADILPITTPAAFALEHPPPEPRLWFQSQIEKKASTSVEPPGKRFSIREIRCRPEHYRWLQNGLKRSF